MAPFDDCLKLRLFRIMLESRLGDQREQSLIRQGKGWFQISSAGHESMAAVGVQLESGDYIAPYYRDRALVLAKGLSSSEIALNFLGKRNASSGGRQLPGHYSDRSKNIWSHASPVACHLLPACGIAWGLQFDRKPNVVVTSLGEAATRQGDFFEAVCIAKEKKLPVVFIVEDNKLGISTPNAETNPLAIGALNADDWIKVDGTDAEEVYLKASEAIAHARSGRGPSFLWVDLERLDSHSSADDHRNYRANDELDSLAAHDPIALFKHRLFAEGLLTEESFNALEQEMKLNLRNCYLEAEKTPDPTPEDTTCELFAPGSTPESPPVRLKPRCRMVDAINLTLRAAIENDANTLLYGQDIADPKGGVFKLTVGLSTDFPENVFNAPVAESTIVGLACGLAGYGKRPVFEIQFIDFISPAWNQLVSNLATLRWRTFGDWECPVVIYAPCGAYLPGGAIWHSQTNESFFASIPGIKVVVPSTPSDAVNLFWTSMKSNNPVLILIPKHLMWEEQNVTVQPEPTALGLSRLVRSGNGISVITWGNCLELVEKAGQSFPSDLLDVVDLRSIVPWDMEAVKRSVQKTGKLLIVQEDTPNCSVGQMILAELVQDPRLWKTMKATPILISRQQVHIGLNPVYEYAALPDAAEVERAIRQLEASSIKRETLTAPLSASSGLIHREDEQHPQISGVSKTTRVQRIQVPTLGEGIQSARVIGLLKKDGDVVQYDDPLCELETDKAVFPVESSSDGSFVRWLIAADDEVRVGQDIAEIAVPDVEVESSALRQIPVFERESSSNTMSGAVGASKKLINSLIGRVFHSEGERERKSGLSQEIVQAMQGIVPATITLNANWQGIKEARKRAKSLYGKKAPSPSVMVAWNALQAMKNHEMFTYTVAMDRLNRDKNTGEFDLGVAVSLPDDELQTAIIRKANMLNWEEFVDEFTSAIGRARRGERDSKTRAPLLISTMGPFDVRSAVPVVVPPSIATLFIGSAHFEPIPTADGHALREVVHLSLTFDHRWINGVGSAAFMTEVRKNIEEFKLPE